VTQLLAFVKFYLGDVDEAERLARQTLTWLERTADRYCHLQDLRCMAKFALWRGDFVAAEERLVEALPLAIESGGWLVVEINRYLAEAVARQGRTEDARRAAEAARESLPEEDQYARAAALLAEAFVATAGGDEHLARGRFDAALPMIEEQSLWIDLGEARIAYARALRRFGDHAAAAKQLDLARETFEPMEARALLEEIDRERALLTNEGGRRQAPLASS
jgi:hypothetical protein